MIVTSFGFFCRPDNVRVNDQRVKSTIVSFIVDFFNKNPENNILYLCDTKDDLARHRRIIFGRWHREINENIEKYNCNEHHARQGYYSSLLIKADNPQKHHYIDAFYRHLNELLPEDDN